MSGTVAAQQFQPPRCEIVPLASHQVSLRIDGREKLRWHYGREYPRPFFFPLNGPAGQPLTRMGHPGAADHDHHRSIWFAHHKVDGLNFWSDNTDTKIVQTHWYRYRDGTDEAVMAMHLSWIDGMGVERMQQDVVTALLPIGDQGDQGEHAIEFQLTFCPGSGRDAVNLEPTNFGFLAVRVAASLSQYFGGGRISNHQGVEAEQALHESRAPWIDYSGPVAVPTPPSRRVVEEGIAFFDHPDNPGYPTHWHVRRDGWMGAAPGMHSAFRITSETPLQLRYLLYAHAGPADPRRAAMVHQQFKNRSGFRIRKATSQEAHRQYEVERLSVDQDGQLPALGSDARWDRNWNCPHCASGHAAPVSGPPLH